MTTYFIQAVPSTFLIGPDDLKIPIIAWEIEGAGGETIAHGPSGPLLIAAAEMPGYSYDCAGTMVPLKKRAPDTSYGFSQRSTTTEEPAPLSRRRRLWTEHEAQMMRSLGHRPQDIL
jgi:hypothetical protein